MRILLYIILQQIKNGITTLQGLAFVPQNGASNINGVKTFTSEPIIPTPTLDTSPATKLYVDKPTKYAVSGVATNITVATGDFDFNTLTNPSQFNDFTFTCSGASATINHILNLPHGSIIRVLTGKTITFAQKVDSATGYINNVGGSSFVGAGTNGDWGFFVAGVGAYIQRIGGGNFGA